MKVRELIEALQYMDGDLDVHFSYNYGDHWRTEVAPRVSNIDMEYSEYHRMPKVVEVDYDDEDSAEQCKGNPVVLIG